MDADGLRSAVKRLNLGADETLCFLSHHKAGAGKDARILKDRLSELLKISKEKIFLDSDQHNLDLNYLLDHLRKSRVVVLIQTKETLSRPYIIAEVVAALEAGIPIVTVVTRDGGYDFTQASLFLNAEDFREQLEKGTPGCVAVLERQGIDIARAGKLLNESIPQLISKGLNLNDTDRMIKAAVEDIAESIVTSKMVIKRSPETTDAVIDVPAAFPQPKKTTMMISYNWDSQPLAIKIRDSLEAKGVTVLIDIGDVKGDFLQWMAESVTAADAILLLLTPKYEASQNCKAEANFAYQQNKKIIPLLGERGYTGGMGWLAILTSGKSRYDVVDDFDKSMANIV